MMYFRKILLATQHRLDWKSCVEEGESHLCLENAYK